MHALMWTMSHHHSHNPPLSTGGSSRECSWKHSLFYRAGLIIFLIMRGCATARWGEYCGRGGGHLAAVSLKHLLPTCGKKTCTSGNVKLQISEQNTEFRSSQDPHLRSAYVFRVLRVGKGPVPVIESSHKTDACSNQRNELEPSCGQKDPTHACPQRRSQIHKTTVPGKD